VKVTVSILEKRNEGTRRPWSHLFGGRMRTSTLVLIIAFFATWWVYDTYRPEPAKPPAPQVVPPGFVPDPNYTWVPRSRVQQPPATTFTPTPSSTVPSTPTTTVPIPTTTTTTTPPPFGLPTLPCLLPPPFCPPSQSPTPSPPPGPGPVPTSPAPVG
jgi:hypothetical protein